jgi:hypothetical protein
MPAGTWVETGTYLGETTAMLAAAGGTVHTIEPAVELHRRAVERFRHNPRVTVHAGTSEDVLPRLLPSLRGPVTFWLDGHWSGGETFRGNTDCPLVHELAAIDRHLRNQDRTVLLIDDIRCLDPTVPDFAHYPSLDHVVDRCRVMGFRWWIEHDILVGVRDNPAHAGI